MMDGPLQIESTGNTCVRLPRTATKAERTAQHRAKMARKAVGPQRSGKVGVLPMPNRRIDAAIQGQFALLMVSHAEQIASGSTDPRDLQAIAIREVTRTLPRPRMARDWAYGRPSKQDDPAYRKN